MNLSFKVCEALFQEKLIDEMYHLSNGKMGKVYKIVLKNGKTLCVKILTKDHPTKFADYEGWQLAYKDLEFDFKSYEDNKYFYFTIPYFEGEPFHFAMGYKLKSRFEITQNLIKAITNIHRRGIIHRDLTCDNIIINKETNKVYIIDFGRSVNAFNLYATNSDRGYMKNLQLLAQNATISNIIRILQPYTAPEYFRKHYNNDSTIGFRSDYYSIAQLFRLLIPNYSYLADKILLTEGIDRNAEFTEFSNQIGNILKKNKENPKFSEPENNYSTIFILYKRIIFFIREIFYRLFNLIFPFPVSTHKKNTDQNKNQDIAPVFFKQNKSNTLGSFSLPLPQNHYSLK